MENAGTLSAGAGSPSRSRPAPAHLRRLRTAAPYDRATYDRLTSLVSVLLDVPVALLTVVSPVDEVFVSTFGIPNRWGPDNPLPVTRALCQHVVNTGEPLVVSDARRDAVAREAELLDEVDVVAYLGAPLVTHGGDAVGTFCAIDTRPRAWTERDVRTLADLAATVMAYVEADAADGPSAPPAGALNIAAVARRTGVAADTLRKWERRYGVLRPRRTAGGQRRYDDSDVARVEWLRDRLTEGFRISEAAALLDPAGDDAHATEAALRDALVGAAQAADAAQLVALVEQTFALHPVDVAVEEIVRPALERVGSQWRERSGAIAEEHLLTETVRARLERLLADRRPGVRGRAVLACGPGERHDVGLLALGVLLQADGWLVAYLGADAPLDAVADLVRRSRADALCVSLTSAEAHARFREHLDGAGLPPSVRVLVGGSAVQGAPRLADAVAQLRR